MTMSVEDQDIKRLTDEEYNRVKYDYSDDSKVSLVLIAMSFCSCAYASFLEETLIWATF